MNPSPRHVLPLLIVAFAATAALGVLVAHSGHRAALPVPPLPSADTSAAVPEPAPTIAADAWAAFVPDAQGARALARRFRLAGTLLGDAAERPLAVFDDRAVARQRLVRLGDTLDEGIRLVEVRSGEAVLDGPAGRVAFAVERLGSHASDTPAHETVSSGDGPAARFGGREVFPGRWEFPRDRLLDYYAELRREPERLVAVFDSLEPLWKDGDPDSHIIQGYRLNVQGEADFFEAMGMRQGDIVRAVNSVQMSNRVRAEAFLSAFVLGEMDTFAIDFERDGHADQRVYVTR